MAKREFPTDSINLLTKSKEIAVALRDIVVIISKEMHGCGIILKLKSGHPKEGKSEEWRVVFCLRCSKKRPYNRFNLLKKSNELVVASLWIYSPVTQKKETKTRQMTNSCCHEYSGSDKNIVINRFHQPFDKIQRDSGSSERHQSHHIKRDGRGIITKLLPGPPKKEGKNGTDEEQSFVVIDVLVVTKM